MDEISRKEAIIMLGIMHESLKLFPEVAQKQKMAALRFAIRSLKTDEAYQLLYESNLDNDVVLAAEILKILDEWKGTEHPELTKTEYFDKIIDIVNAAKKGVSDGKS